MKILRQIDLLSPKITLYNKGFLHHTSIISSLLSILAIYEIFIISLNYLISISRRESQTPQAFSLNYFIEDAGTIVINSSSLFHFISIAKNRKNYNDQDFDFSNFRAIGFEAYLDDYINDKNLSYFDHWLYGPCNNGSDIEEINNLITQSYFTKSACIMKYFNRKDNKYYNINETNFKWPKMAHGRSNYENIFYSIIIEKCEQNTLNEIFKDGRKCSNNEKIENLLNNNIINFNFIDQYINITDYKNPIKKYIYSVEKILDKNNFYINNINFNPSYLITNDGLIFDNSHVDNFYTFDRNELLVDQNKNNNNIFMGYYLLLNNRMNYYLRIYKGFTDFVSDIGGTSNGIFNCLYFINLFFNSYNILTDTEELLSSSSLNIKEILNPKKDILSQNFDKKNHYLLKSNQNQLKI